MPLPAPRQPEVIMKRVVYCSQATFDLGPEQLMTLLEVARRHNTRAGLSGLLLYSSQSFLQVLEGDGPALASTYSRILVDDRHTNVRLLLDAEVAAPMFPDWTMGFEYLEAEDLAAELTGFTPATRYPLVNPDLITNAAVAQTLLGLYGRNRTR